MVSQPSKRSPRRRVESTRTVILDATESLLLEVGPDRLSIRLVTNRCGYQAPTIYHHFGDKAGLIDACLERRFQDLHDELLRVPRRLDPAEYLRELARAFIRFGVEHPAHYRLFSVPRRADVSVPSSAERGRELVAEALKDLERVNRLHGTDAETALQITWAMLHGLILLRISRPDYEWTEDLTERALDSLERGLFEKESGAE